MTSKNKINVLITAIGGGGFGEQILKSLRMADGQRYQIYGSDSNPHCAQFSLTEGHSVLPTAGSANYLEELLKLCETFKIDALFPGCEPELKFISDNRKEIENLGVFLPINPSNVIDCCMDKSRTFQMLQEKGFEVPFFIGVAQPSDLELVEDFPVVVKPAIGGGGSANVFVAQDMAELRALSAYLDLGGRSSEFLIQEYVGTPEAEFTVGVLHDMEGNHLNAIGLRRMLSGQLNVRGRVKNRTSKSSLGEWLVISSGISHGKLARFSEVTDQCCRVAEAIGARSALNIQCRVVNGRISIMEINPRFSGTSSLRAMVGYNEPDVLLRQRFFGEIIEPDFEYEEATILRSLYETRI